jgi:hypothetical protein
MFVREVEPLVKSVTSVGNRLRVHPLAAPRAAERSPLGVDGEAAQRENVVEAREIRALKRSTKGAATRPSA